MIDTSYLNFKSGLRSMSIYKHLTSSKFGGLARGCIEVGVCKWIFICSMFWIRFYKICASLQTQNVRKYQYFSLNVLQMLIKFANGYQISATCCPMFCQISSKFDTLFTCWFVYVSYLIICLFLYCVFSLFYMFSK